MAPPLPPGLTPSEVGFLCEMEHVTVIPRQTLDGLELLGGPTGALKPPFPTPLPLWLALLLKKQRRANITPPPWLSVEALTQILDFETDERTAELFSPSPNLPPATTSAPLGDAATARAQADALPYHWLEIGHLLITHAADDFDDLDAVRKLLRDLREVRMSKLRKGFEVLDAGGGVKMNGVGGMEIAEVRGFVGGVVDGLRRLNRSREESRKERETEERENGLGSSSYRDDEDEDML
ncbi:DNA replication protein psf2 [Friedmanniomyces endolithicus]|uniref:DNA replication complex GINS protein PSF2 n=1 Tax=Friedmanniomyces endolithicus TaxID=329885 RepID=A0AAN6QT13_9PEZI|nr:DNA replication protein psf2 [Friedmanniomyces endolithicus]KAK0770370.1 DNA replication protein psf2 [Friedmanniomyces endolithicus]KAK0801848.1 DNA replication protein psf2 [Friedmanniomyces endolithicus]KAK0817023.1 DNA replication protein psf2 [Friedmanniomyces endolithicus]KAK0858642.1 DNA replication protein psf2 [Friedmanniomyces endolithicus]